MLSLSLSLPFISSHLLFIALLFYYILFYPLLFYPLQFYYIIFYSLFSSSLTPITEPYATVDKKHTVTSTFLCSGQLESPKVVHVYHRFRQPEGENVCASHGCSHLCVRSPKGQPICLCPDNMTLSRTDPYTCNDGQSLFALFSP